MQYFSEDFNRFFIELAPNNHKDWFNLNRDRYVKSVKEPFERFITDLIGELARKEPKLDVDPKSTIFRINRDIRFSNDKSPYKLNRSAAIAPDGKKSIAQGGLYIELGPERIAVGGGAFQPGKEELMKLREHIVRHPKKLRKAIESSSFIETYRELQGAENKRLPTKELMIAAQKEPLLFKKSLYYFAEFPPDKISSSDLMSFILAKYRDADNVRNFIAAAVS